VRGNGDVRNAVVECGDDEGSEIIEKIKKIKNEQRKRVNALGAALMNSRPA
jgi:hypothetical protein